MHSMWSCSSCRLCTLFCTGVFLLVGGGIMIPIVDMVVRDQIKKTVIIANDSLLYDIWSEPDIPIYMQFYIFNVTNPQEIRNGEKPAVFQKGPYTYQDLPGKNHRNQDTKECLLEKRKKFNITFYENGTVSYKQNRTFFFLRDQSAGDELTDIFTTANPPILAVIEALQYAPKYIRNLISDALSLQQEDVFMTKSVRDLLWGYTDPSLKILNHFFPDWFYTDIVGYFINKNNTDDGSYNVFTGENDITTLGHIDLYNGSRFLPYWSTTWANMVNGSDGTISPPFEQNAQTLPMFSSDICRSVYGTYQQDVKSPQGIKLHRFGGTPSELANISINPDNIGFCTPKTKCLPTGLLNVSNCQIVDSFKIPVVISFPHFYMADPAIIHSVDGINPVPEEHQTAVDVEPWTGQILQAFKRLQINMYLTKVDGIRQAQNLPSVFLPVFWLNESAVIDDKHAALLQQKLFTPLEVCSVLEKACMSIGSGLILLVVFILCKTRLFFQDNTMPPVPAELPNQALHCQQSEEQTRLLRTDQLAGNNYFSNNAMPSEVTD